MSKKLVLFLAFLLGISVIINAQNNFKLSPAKPKPGDKITFTYTPPEGFVTEQLPLRCDAYKFGLYDEQLKYGARPLKCELVKLSKTGNTYSGEVKSDPETRFLAFAFTAGKVVIKYVSGKQTIVKGKADVNGDESYSTLFYDNNGRELSLSNFLGGYYYGGSFFNGLAFSKIKLAAQMFEREIEIDSTSRVASKGREVQLLMDEYPAEGKKIAMAEIDRAFQNGLKTEEDYSSLGNSALFYYAGFKNANTYFRNLGKEKFATGNGLFGASARQDAFYYEKDIDKKARLAAELEQFYENAPWLTRFRLAGGNMTPRQFYKMYLKDLAEAGRIDELKAGMKKAGRFPFYYAGYVAWTGITDTLIRKKDPAVLDLLNDEYKYVKSRWESLKTNPDQPAADPSEECLTTANRMKEVNYRLTCLQNQYAQYYYNTGDYKKGFDYAKQAFKLVEEGDFEFYSATDVANTYLNLLEETSSKDCKAFMEKLVVADCTWPEIKEKLKTIYVDENKTEEGFKQYYAGLMKASGKGDIKEIIASMLINKPAPSFALMDLNGNKVSIESLKGKTVILDFWATWCGPCIASFPAMSKLIDKYKENKDVVILFMNTWETGFKTNDELKQRVVDFIKKRNLDFKVLLDAQGDVASDFGISGIPTKIIIDKNGNMRYKITSAETDEEKLIEEMNAMIESIK